MQVWCNRRHAVADNATGWTEVPRTGGLGQDHERQSGGEAPPEVALAEGQLQEVRPHLQQAAAGRRGRQPRRWLHTQSTWGVSGQCGGAACGQCDTIDNLT